MTRMCAITFTLLEVGWWSGGVRTKVGSGHNPWIVKNRFESYNSGKCTQTQHGGGGAVVWYFLILLPTQFKLH